MKKILVLDDDRFIQVVTRAMLEPEGYAVNSVTSVDDAIAAIEAHSYDLIITDILMPEKSGIHFMQYLRKGKIKTPILAITGGVENAAEEYANFASLYADHAMIKPLHRDMLVDCVRNMMNSSPVN